MKRILILAFVATFCLSGFAQEKKATPATPQKAATTEVKATSATSKADVNQSTNQTVVIQTNGVCGMCKDRFMENVPFFKGVKDCKYDMATSKLTVIYDLQKTDADAIRQGISKWGYSADAVKADEAARAKLPACCRADKKAGAHENCGGQH